MSYFVGGIMSKKEKRHKLREMKRGKKRRVKTNMQSSHVIGKKIPGPLSHHGVSVIFAHELLRCWIYLLFMSFKSNNWITFKIRGIWPITGIHIFMSKIVPPTSWWSMWGIHYIINEKITLLQGEAFFIRHWRFCLSPLLSNCSCIAQRSDSSYPKWRQR